MALTIRELEGDEHATAFRLGLVTFGHDRNTPVPPPPQPPAESTRWGAFDEAGRLVGKAIDLHQGQWWGGRVLASSGVAGVAVVPELRGQGITRALLAALLSRARERGAVVSALFCTSSRVYRSAGFEVGGVTRQVDFPTMALPAAGKSGVRLRPGDGSDWPAIRQVYDDIARSTNGLLTRRGRNFADPEGTELPAGIDGVTIAEDDAGNVVGYATWNRGRGYGPDSVLKVEDCFAFTADAAAAIVGSLRGWDMVAPTVRFRSLPWLDAIALQLPQERATQHDLDIWMHRPVDVVAAVTGRGWQAGASGSVAFELDDPVIEANSGGWRLTVGGGEGSLERVPGDVAPRLSVRGWSLLYCGAARAAQIRQAGLLTGGDAADDAALDATLGCGGPAALLDYF